MKKLLYAYLTLMVFIKAVSSGYLFITGSTGLPSIIFGISLVLVVSGAAVVARYLMGKESPNEVALYFSAFAIGTLFNLIFVNREVLADIGMLEMAVTGNLFDVVLAAVVVFICIRQKNAAKANFAPQTNEAVSKAR